MIPIHVAYAEDHPLLRTTTSDLLEQNGFIVSSFDNGRDMIHAMQAMPVPPDVCLVNIRMTRISGFEAAQQIRTRFPQVKVLAYSMSDYDADVIKMLTYGADGYLIKNGNIDELCQAIAVVHEKGVYINEEVSKIILRYLRKG